MTPRERKAAFKHAVEMNDTTCEAAARDQMGVTWYHLSLGLAGDRQLSGEVEERFAEYIGKRRGEVFAPRDAGQGAGNATDHPSMSTGTGEATRRTVQPTEEL